MAKAKTTKTTAKKSAAKAAEAAPVNAATTLLHTLCKSLAEAIVADPKIAKLADSYGLSFVGEEADSEYEEEDEEELDSEDEEFEEEEEDEEEEAPKSKKAAPAKGGKKKKALTADDIIEVLDGDDADAAEEMFNSLEDEDMIREIAVALKLVKAKAAAKTDADTLTEMIGEHFGIGEESEEDEEEGIDPDEMSEEELLEFVIEHKLATKAKAKKLDEDELRALVEEYLDAQEEEEEEEDDEEEEEEDEFDDEEEEEEEDDEFDDEFDEE
jgi:HIV Tat-specific factor 1